MLAYRIGKKEYVKRHDGKGGLEVEGRWHTKGHEMIYTSQALSLCLWEIFKIHNLQVIPKDIMGITIDIPDDLIVPAPQNLFKDGWNRPGIYNAEIQGFGDKWLSEKRALVLEVPSAVVPGDKNYLINPNHQDMHQIRITRFFEIEINQGYMNTRERSV
jgi:RES domain-containing protein